MTNTQNFNLIMAEGSDAVNPLTQIFPNFQTIDTVMKANQDAGVTTAVETKSGTNHAIVRTHANGVFRFVATSNFATGDTFTVDGQSVTATLPDGTSLQDGAFVINASVLCVLVGTSLTVFAFKISAVASDSAKLGGELPAHYAKQSDMEQALFVVSFDASTGALVTKSYNYIA